MLKADPEQETTMTAVAVAPISTTTQDVPGVFRLVDKQRLQVDPRYQREVKQQRRVDDIAANWSWRLFGTLTVVSRTDNDLMVIDGQHRLMAAMTRDDIRMLPCMIFMAQTNEIADEATSFIGINTARSTVTPYDIHRASYVAGDEAAVAVQHIVERSGYRLTSHTDKGTTQRPRVRCVKTLIGSWRHDPLRMERVWNLTVQIARKKCIQEHLFNSLFTLECAAQHWPIQTICDGTAASVLIAAGQDVILDAIKRFSYKVASNGPLVRAEAVSREILNKHLRGRLRLPSLLDGKTTTTHE